MLWSIELREKKVGRPTHKQRIHETFEGLTHFLKTISMEIPIDQCLIFPLLTRSVSRVTTLAGNETAMFQWNDPLFHEILIRTGLDSILGRKLSPDDAATGRYRVATDKKAFNSVKALVASLELCPQSTQGSQFCPGKFRLPLYLKYELSNTTTI